MGSIYTVTQVNSHIKHMFDSDFALTSVSIKGEVSNCKYHSSGHIYFSLKDGGSVISAVMFAGNRNGLSFALKEGQKVIATGAVSVYERDGKYQLYAKQITLDGQGDLYRKFEELKASLLEMGMFDVEYKKPIPKYALKVGIVTSGTGAAIADITNIATRRNPYVQLYLYPAIVQGVEAVPSIISGINCLDEMGMDVIIVGRGGGSIEDLWAFNDENVARAIFSSKTPIISAVGHEVDTTIADFVADLRAPTPSAAAELAVFDYNRFEEELESCVYTMQKLFINKLNRYKTKLENITIKLESKNPINQVNDKRQYLDSIYDRMYNKMINKLRDNKNKLSVYAEKLNGLSPLTRIDKGFAYVAKDNKKIKSIMQVKEDDILDITVTDGVIKAKVIGTHNE